MVFILLLDRDKKPLLTIFLEIFDILLSNRMFVRARGARRCYRLFVTGDR
jgi:hypothetical protein